MPALLPRQSRALALVLLLAALAAAAVAVIWPLAALRRGNIEAAHLKAGIARFAKLADGRVALETRLRALRSGEVNDGNLFNAATVNQATAALQHLVEEVVTQAGAHTDTVEILPEQSQGPLLRIGERLTMSGDIEAVRRILYRLEAGKPALFGDNLRMRIADTAAQAPARLATDKPEKPVKLAVIVELYGFALTRAASAPAPQ